MEFIITTITKVNTDLIYQAQAFDFHERWAKSSYKPG